MNSDTPRESINLRLFQNSETPIELPGSNVLRAILALERIADAIERLAPPLNEYVDTRFVSECLGCSDEYVARLARTGQIPQNCIVAGSGQGKPWKFHKVKIQEWIQTR